MPLLRLFALLPAFIGGSYAHAATTIRYPLLATANDPQQQYMPALLRLACQKAGVNCLLKPARPMVQSRALLQLQ